MPSVIDYSSKLRRLGLALIFVGALGVMFTNVFSESSPLLGLILALDGLIVTPIGFILFAKGRRRPRL